jgi:dTDP-glucose 4,6-dehydratase
MLEGYSNFTFVQGDITSPEQVREVIEDYGIDTIMHLAAESHVDHSFGNPYQFTYTNALGTQVLLEAAKTYKVTRFIHMSTDEVYGEVSDGHRDLLESSILVPTNPYAASKAAADMLVCAYMKSFQVPAIIVRCNNVYGPHQFPEKIIPKFICLLKRGSKCYLHGNGRNTRRYVYAADAVSALDTVLHRGTIGKIYNAGSEVEMSNYQVYLCLLKLFGYDVSNNEVISSMVEFTRDRPFNDFRYAVDSTELRNLGWLPQISLDDGLQKTVDWYLEYGDSWWNDITSVLSAFPQTVRSALPSPIIQPATI